MSGIAWYCLLHTYAAFAAALARYVSWRGIRYEVQAPRSLRMLGYVPWAAASRARPLSVIGESAAVPIPVDLVTGYDSLGDTGVVSLP